MPSSESESAPPPEPRAIELAGEDDVALAADFVPGPAPESPVVVLYHQLGHDRTEWDALGETLHTAGFGVLRLDLRGHGASEGGPGGWRDFDRESWATAARDGVAPLDWLEAEEGVEPSAIVLGGSSIGSSVALIAGADPRVDGVFALSPGRAYHGLDVLTPVDGYPEDRPVLAIASRGEVPSAETARDLARIAPTGSARLVEGSAHGLAMVADEAGLVSVLEGFVREAAGP